MLEKFAPTIKSCSNGAKWIIEQFPDLITLNKIPIVWLEKGKQKTNRIFPVCKLVEHNNWNKINIHELMGNTIGQCKKLVGKWDTIKEMKQAFVEMNEIDDIDEPIERYVAIRLDKFNGSINNRIIVRIDEAKDFIKTNLSIGSCHELLEDTDTTLYRFFMDIDSKSDEFINIDQINNNLTGFIKCSFSIANPILNFIRKSDKSESFHVYGNFATTLNTMKHIVTGLSKHIDLQVYKNNTSLRMCNSYKYNIKDKTTTTTYYEPNCLYTDTIISNIEGLPIIRPNIGLSKQPHYYVTDQTVKSQLDIKIIEKLDNIFGKDNYNIKQSSKYYICIIKTSYKCPNDSSITHESQNSIIYTKQKNDQTEYYLKCYSQKCNNSIFHIGNAKTGYELSVEESLKQKIQANTMHLNNGLIPTQSNWYLKFEQSGLRHGQLICIKSPMGSGKTNCITKTFTPESKVLYISTRITFTQSLSSKYNMMSYLDAQAQKIPLAFSDEHKKWMVQIDSLNLFTNAQIADIIVIDEIESLWDQITVCKNQFEVFKSFINLLNIHTTTYVMDAMLQMTTIEMITKLGNWEPYEIIYNDYKPMNEHKIIINRLSKKIMQKTITDGNQSNTTQVRHDNMYKLIEKSIKSGKRVVCCVSSWNTGEYIKQHIQ